jgi:cytochrome b6-f complex iron-sulfur subunit
MKTMCILYKKLYGSSLFHRGNVYKLDKRPPKHTYSKRIYIILRRFDGMKRRQFIQKAAGTLVLVAGISAAVSYLRQFFPRRAGERRRIPLGDPQRFPVDTYTFLADHNLFVYRDHEGIRAVSAVCTHLGCILEKSTDGFSCPCHGSTYNEEGEVMSGPAPADLAWFEVTRAADGRIVIDPGKRVDAEYKYLIS